MQSHRHPHRGRRRMTRRLQLESLETRTLLAGDLRVTLGAGDDAPDHDRLEHFVAPHVNRAEGEAEGEGHHRKQRNGGRNPIDPLDVDGDFFVAPIDVLTVVSDLNRNGSRGLSDDPPGDDRLPFLDVNDDKFVAPIDVLLVANGLNNPSLLSLGKLSELEGTLEGHDVVRGETEFEIEREHGVVRREFKVQIEHADPGSLHDVLVDGVLVGQIEVDGAGVGQLKFSTDSSDPDAVPFPDDFPDVTAGTQVSVGGLVHGPLSIRDDSPASAGAKEVKAILLGDSSAVGEAEFESEPEDGGTKLEFKVQLEHAVAGTYDIEVAQVHVGQITVDARGKGRVRFSSNPNDGESLLPADFPAIAAGTLVTISNGVSGEFASGLPDDDGGETTDPVSLSADLTGDAGALGTAVFASHAEDGGVQREFELEVEDAQPGSEHDVTIDGVLVARLTIDSEGKARLKLNDTPAETELPFPDDFPELAAESQIVVGEILSGTFA